MFLYGADYNPEQWKKYPEILEKDIQLMKKASCNIMSVGIFAWSEIEPREGEYDFSFYKMVLDKLYENDIQVFLATPSGAKPVWMSKKYPEVLRTDEFGRRHTHGERHNHCFTSPVYREKVRQINSQIVENLGAHPAVFGWHISNEYGGECHCDLCKDAFRKWLRNKYKTIENLNEQWWTAFWSHTFYDFDEIDPPGPIGESSLHGLVLDWKRFVTYQTIDFYKEEIKPIRKKFPDKLITTNFHGELYHLDYWKFKDVVDIISYDAYPEWESDKSNYDVALETGFVYDVCRSYKNKPFLLMESTPSNVNWRDFAKLKENGTNMLSSLQAVACGADSVQYFQWRKSRGGPEKFHGAVIDHNGNSNTRVFSEVSKLGQKLLEIKNSFNSDIESDIAIIFDCENKWAMENAQGFGRENRAYQEECLRHYKEIMRYGKNIDIIDSEQDFSKYKIIIAPMLYMIKNNVSVNIKRFIENGGVFIATYMLGYVNENDLCYLEGFPGGGLKDVFGICNEEIDALYPQQKLKLSYKTKEYEAIDYVENIHNFDAETIAEFHNLFGNSSPAVTVKKVGKGKAYYIAFRDENFLTDFYEEILNDELLPYGIFHRTRKKEDKYYHFFQNYTDEVIEFDYNKNQKFHVLLDPKETKVLSFDS